MHLHPLFAPGSLSSGSAPLTHPPAYLPIYLPPARYDSTLTLGDLLRSRFVLRTSTRLSPDLWRWWRLRSSTVSVVVTFSRSSRRMRVSVQSSFCSSGGTQRLMMM